MSAKRKPPKNNLSSVKSNTSEGLLENSKNEGSVKPQASDFSDILHKKWKVFRVSPIFNFHSSKLKVYGKKFREELNAKKAFDSNVTYDCAFTLNEKLRLDDKSVEALQVEVITDQLKNIYLGYFISWSCTSENLQNFVSLPILLVESKDHNAQKVNSIFCKMFDCDIQPVTFSLHALVSFFVKFLENPKQNPNGSQDGLTLEYKIPGCEAKDSIKISLVLEDTIIVLAVIIDSLREKVPGISNMEVILEFYNRLLNHIYHVYKMDLMMAELNKITLPYAFITADGQNGFLHKEVVTGKQIMTKFMQFIKLSVVDLYNGTSEFRMSILGQSAYLATDLEIINNGRNIKMVLALETCWSKQYGPRAVKFGDSFYRNKDQEKYK